MSTRTITIFDTPEGAPSLTVDCTDEGWNGFHVPILTADQLNDYLAACEAHDPNGEWSQRAFEDWAAGTRVLRLPSWEAPEDRDEDDVWEAVGDVMTSDGYRSAYAIDGLSWQDGE